MRLLMLSDRLPCCQQHAAPPLRLQSSAPPLTPAVCCSPPLSGLDNAGKTTILKAIMGEDISLVSPTLGFNIQTLLFPPRYRLNVWDVGGQQTIRSYWRNYYEQTDGLLFVVDSADTARLSEVKAELHGLLKQEKLAGASLLVFANKQDLQGAESLQQIAERQPACKLQQPQRQQQQRPFTTCCGADCFVAALPLRLLVHRAGLCRVEWQSSLPHRELQRGDGRRAADGHGVAGAGHRLAHLPHGLSVHTAPLYHRLTSARTARTGPWRSATDSPRLTAARPPARPSRTDRGS